MSPQIQTHNQYPANMAPHNKEKKRFTTKSNITPKMSSYKLFFMSKIPLDRKPLIY